MKKELFLILSIALTSCNTDIKETGFLDAVKSAINIDDSLSRMNISVTDISTPLDMVTLSDYIVLASDNSDYMISIYNTKTGFVQKMFPKGHGDNELLDIRQLQIVNRESFCIFDASKQKIFILKLSPDGRFTISESIKLTDYLSFAISDSVIVGCCVGSDYHYKISYRYNDAQTYLGEYDPFVMAPKNGALLLQGKMLLNVSQKRFAWMSYYGIAWQIGAYYEQRIVNTHIYDLPKYHISDGYPVFDKETVVGFVSLTSSNNSIYALVVNKQLEMALYNQEQLLLGRQIIKLDWDGKIDKCYETNNNIKFIAYNKEYNQLIMLIDNNLGYSFARCNL